MIWIDLLPLLALVPIGWLLYWVRRLRRHANNSTELTAVLLVYALLCVVTVVASITDTGPSPVWRAMITMAIAFALSIFQLVRIERRSPGVIRDLFLPPRRTDVDPPGSETSGGTGCDDDPKGSA